MDSRDQSLVWSEIFRGEAAVAFGLVGDESAAGLETVLTQLDVPGPVTHGDMVQICQLPHTPRRLACSELADNSRQLSLHVWRIMEAMQLKGPAIGVAVWPKLMPSVDAVIATARPLRMQIARCIRSGGS